MDAYRVQRECIFPGAAFLELAYAAAAALAIGISLCLADLALSVPKVLASGLLPDARMSRGKGGHLECHVAEDGQMQISSLQGKMQQQHVICWPLACQLIRARHMQLAYTLVGVLSPESLPHIISHTSIHGIAGLALHGAMHMSCGTEAYHANPARVDAALHLGAVDTALSRSKSTSTNIGHVVNVPVAVAAYVAGVTGKSQEAAWAAAMHAAKQTDNSATSDARLLTGLAGWQVSICKVLAKALRQKVRLGTQMRWMQMQWLKTRLRCQ